MKILLLSAYDAASHRYWHQNLIAQFPEYDWTLLTLPGRFFAWRLRGNSLSWAFNERETLAQHYDLVIATSMTDLSSLKGFVPALSQTPCLVYFHENQFAYPRSGHEHPGVEPQILNLYTALAADRVLFNSDFNRRSLLEGAQKLLKKLPDHVPQGLPALIESKSEVLPVPLTEACFLPHQSASADEPLNICWNHRREFDKNGELLHNAMEALEKRGIDYRLHLLGQQFPRQPGVFDEISERFTHRLGHNGFVASVTEYRQLLQSSDVVLSTALHDFQGLAVLEGVAAGAIPVVPDRLAYRELFTPEFRYAEGAQQLNHLTSRLVELARLKREGQLPTAPDIRHLSWPRLRARYQQVIEDTAQGD